MDLHQDRHRNMSKDIIGRSGLERSVQRSCDQLLSTFELRSFLHIYFPPHIPANSNINFSSQVMATTVTQYQALSCWNSVWVNLGSYKSRGLGRYLIALVPQTCHQPASSSLSPFRLVTLITQQEGGTSKYKLLLFQQLFTFYIENQILNSYSITKGI